MSELSQITFGAAATGTTDPLLAPATPEQVTEFQAKASALGL